MHLRPYTSSDCLSLAQLFYATVHTINAKDYTLEQLNSWATGTVDLIEWNSSFLEHYTVVAEENNQIVGFGDIGSNGYLDRLFVHKDRQRQGIATALCDALESFTKKRITTHASITARPFFEHRGYTVLDSCTAWRCGVALPYFVMELKKRR